MSDRYFLIERWDGQLRRITAYDARDHGIALNDYATAEANDGFGIFRKDDYEVVLLGGDRLPTLIATHGNWFDEPSRLDEVLRECMSGDPAS